MARGQAFQVGDVVRLKSGGPRMTVTALAGTGAEVMCTCTWFSYAFGADMRPAYHGEALSATFPYATLIMAVTGGRKPTMDATSAPRGNAMASDFDDDLSDI